MGCFRKTVLWALVIVCVFFVYMQRLLSRGDIFFRDLPKADFSIDLTGKTVIVTGATAGLGLELSRAFSYLNATTIMTGRSPSRCEAAVAKIQKDPKATGKLICLGLNLMNFKSIKKFAEEFLALNMPLNILFNNAGVGGDNSLITDDGLGETMGTNHFGPFLLTNLLLPHMIKSSSNESIGRILTMTSDHHIFGSILYDNLDLKGYTGFFPSWFAYGSSKLANLLFSQSLAQRLHGSMITANAVHPGYIKTEIGHTAGLIKYLAFEFAFSLVSVNHWQGIQTPMWAATDPDLDQVSGRFMQVGWIYPPLNREARWSSPQRDYLWKKSCEITGVKDWNSYLELIKE